MTVDREAQHMTDQPTEHRQIRDDPTAVALCSCGTAGMVRALDEADAWFAHHVATATPAAPRYSADDGADAPERALRYPNTAPGQLVTPPGAAPLTDSLPEPESEVGSWVREHTREVEARVRAQIAADIEAEAERLEATREVGLSLRATYRASGLRDAARIARGDA